MSHHIIRHVTYSLDSALLSVALNAVLALFAYLVWRVYRKQLKAMEDTLDEAKRYNQAAEEANHTLIEQTSLNNMHALEQSRLSNEAANASFKIATDSLEAARRRNEIAGHSLIYPNRAWVLFGSIELTKMGENIVEIAIDVNNYGPTPALEVGVASGKLFYPLMAIDAMTFDRPEWWLKYARFDETIPEEIADLGHPPGSHSPLGPRQPGESVRMPQLTPSPEEMEQVKSGAVVFAVIGRIDYKDIFNIPRRTTACWFYLPEKGEFALASKHNLIE
jgi:hypothetical protein